MASPAWLTRPTIGTAWLAIAGHILEHRTPGSWDGAPLTEVLRATLEVDAPAVTDPIIDRYYDADRLAWMHANFADFSGVAELDHADSYATRLCDYARSGRNQIDWVIERIRNDPATRNAMITTFQPLTYTTYVPCVSLLDFWLAEGTVQLGVYAHGIDFGTKGYANLVELAVLQHHVANALGGAVGTLTLKVKSAHVYNTERARMRGNLRGRGRRPDRPIRKAVNGCDSHAGTPATSRQWRPDAATTRSAAFSRDCLRRIGREARTRLRLQLI